MVFFIIITIIIVFIVFLISLVNSNSEKRKRIENSEENKVIKRALEKIIEKVEKHEKSFTKINALEKEVILLSEKLKQYENNIISKEEFIKEREKNNKEEKEEDFEKIKPKMEKIEDEEKIISAIKEDEIILEKKEIIENEIKKENIENNYEIDKKDIKNTEKETIQNFEKIENDKEIEIKNDKIEDLEKENIEKENIEKENIEKENIEKENIEILEKKEIMKTDKNIEVEIKEEILKENIDFKEEKNKNTVKKIDENINYIKTKPKTEEKIYKNTKSKSNFKEKIKDTVGKVVELEKITKFDFWLNKLGILFLFIGVIFLFRYSFKNLNIPEKIQNMIKIFIVINTGIIMQVFGAKLDKKMRKFSQVLIGGGISIIYASIFTAYHFYSLLEVGFTIILMTAVTTYCFIMSVKQNNSWLAFIAFCGGLITPFLMYNENIEIIAQVVYILFLIAGISVVYILKDWNSLIWLSFFGGFLSLILYTTRSLDTSEKIMLQIEIIFYWLLIWFVPILREYLNKHNPDKWKKPEIEFLKNSKVYNKFLDSTLYIFTIISPITIIFHTYILWEFEKVNLNFILGFFSLVYFGVFLILKKIKLKYWLENMNLIVSVNCIAVLTGNIFDADIFLIVFTIETIGLFIISKIQKDKILYRTTDIFAAIGYIYTMRNILSEKNMILEVIIMFALFITYLFREGNSGIVYRTLQILGLILLSLTFDIEMAFNIWIIMSMTMFISGKIFNNKNLITSSNILLGVNGVIFLIKVFDAKNHYFLEIMEITMYLFALETIIRYILSKTKEKEEYFIIMCSSIILLSGNMMYRYISNMNIIIFIISILLLTLMYIAELKKYDIIINKKINIITIFMIFLSVYLIFQSNTSGTYYLNLLTIVIYTVYEFFIIKDESNKVKTALFMVLSIWVLKTGVSIYYILFFWMALKAYRVYFKNKIKEDNIFYNNNILIVIMIIIINIYIKNYSFLTIFSSKKDFITLDGRIIRFLTEFLFIVLSTKVYIELNKGIKFEKYRMYIVNTVLYGFIYRDFIGMSEGIVLVSFIWGIAAVFSIIFGMMKKKNYLITSGITGIILLSIKLFFMDMKNAPEGYKVILFIGYGIVFLVLSYSIQKYIAKNKDEKNSIGGEKDGL